MPPRSIEDALRGERGTASVELIAVIPFLLLAVAVAAQIALAGQAMWSAGVAARAGARAARVGADPSAAARQALPEAMRGGAEIRGRGTVSVRVPVPDLLPSLPRLTVVAGAGLGGGDG